MRRSSRPSLFPEPPSRAPENHEPAQTGIPNLGLAREQFASTSAYAGVYNSVLGYANQFTTAQDTSPVVNAMASSGAAHVSELKRTADRLDDRLASAERELQLDRRRQAVEGK